VDFKERQTWLSTELFMTFPLSVVMEECGQRVPVQGLIDPRGRYATASGASESVRVNDMM
jgi:hypothetical protein